MEKIYIGEKYGCKEDREGLTFFSPEKNIVEFLGLENRLTFVIYGRFQAGVFFGTE